MEIDFIYFESYILLYCNTYFIPNYKTFDFFYPKLDMSDPEGWFLFSFVRHIAALCWLFFIHGLQFVAGRHTIYSQEVLMVLPWLGRFGSSKGEVNFIVYTDGIVVIWEMEIEPTPNGKIASLWIGNITVRSLIFWHAGLTIQTLILFILWFWRFLGMCTAFVPVMMGSNQPV